MQKQSEAVHSGAAIAAERAKLPGRGSPVTGAAGPLSALLFFCLAVSTLVAGCSHSQSASKGALTRRTPKFQQALAERIQERLASSGQAPHLGIEVVSLRDRQVLFSLNASDRFVPASVAKMLTAAAALHSLGPQYRFETQLLAEGYNKATRSVRNLYLRGSGDPSLSVGDLAEMCAALRQQGIKAVTGEIIIDDTAYDASPWAKGWMWDDLADGFSAPISAVNVASNALTLQLAPRRRGEPVRAQVWPQTRYATVLVDAVSVSPNALHSLKVLDGTDRSLIDGPPSPGDLQGSPEAGRSLADVALVPGQKVVVSGSMAESQQPQVRRLAVRNAAAWAATLLHEQLVREGLEPPPNWRRGQTGPLAQLMATHRSAELSELLFVALKASDNHTLECVLKRLGADATLLPGTFANGTQAVRQYLSTLLAHAKVEEPLLLDGSGLSRYNLVTPKLMAALLAEVAPSFAEGPELTVGFPIGGLDGTLAHRQRGSLRGRVRAKTGTMTGVSSLVGLLACEDGEQLAFAIMLDRFIGSSEQARLLQDELLMMLADATDEAPPMLPGAPVPASSVSSRR